ncbi:MAG: hypothetical protein QXI46_02135, partial [Thermoplasmata archaeon]
GIRENSIFFLNCLDSFTTCSCCEFVLVRAAFEITSKHLLQAGLLGESDSLRGVAENIIVGQPITLGTGAVNLIYKYSEKR